MSKNNESKEMYLEVIYELFLNNKEVRSVDIAEKMGYSRPSISRAMSVLKKEGYVIQEPYGTISLTEKGFETGKKILDRHVCLTKFLRLSLNIDKDLAEKDACRFEHVVSEETMEAIRVYVKANLK
ncbi:metal-dependent transcriptional regulator [Gottschalkiaceae bacterium SANA]|nr:metal-dependent transcriptional regulator [Gottschalkiaceae bacterium SANA]